MGICVPHERKCAAAHLRYARANLETKRTALEKVNPFRQARSLSRATGSAPRTSAKPPNLANGTHSAATIKTRRSGMEDLSSIRGYLMHHLTYPFTNSLARWVARTTALIRVTRK